MRLIFKCTYVFISFCAAGPQCECKEPGRLHIPEHQQPRGHRCVTAGVHWIRWRTVDLEPELSEWRLIAPPRCFPSGPILPSTLHAITTLLRPAQKGNFSATLYTHAPTAVMNTHTAKDQVHYGIKKQFSITQTKTISLQLHPKYAIITCQTNCS